MKRKILSAAAVAGFVLLAASLVSIAQPVTTGGGLSRVNVDGSGGLVGSGWTTNPLSIRKDCGAGSGLTWDGNSWECGTLGGIDGTGSTNAVAKWSDADTLTTGSLTDTGSVVTSTVPIDVNNGWVWASQGFYSSSGGPGLVATDQHDVSFASVLEFWPTVANVNVTGVTGGNAATSSIIRYLVVRNIDTGGNTITIAHQSASSTAANRFNLPNATDIVLGQREARLFAYNQNIDRWELVGGGAVGVTELTDNLDLSSNGSTTVGDFRGTTISPSSISGTVNDWAPTGLSTASIIRIDASGTATLTGLTGGSSGREIALCNISGQQVQLAHENVGSTAANRFSLPGAIAWRIPYVAYWAAGSGPECIRLRYDGTLSRWVMASHGLTSIPSLETTSQLYNAGTMQTVGTSTFGGTATFSQLVTVNNRSIVNGGNGVDTFTANLTASGQTADRSTVAVNNTGTFNSTAAARASYGVKASVTSTRSAGANDVTNYGVYSTASGAQVNYSGYFDAGSFKVVGDATFGNLRGTVLITANLGSGVTNDWNPTNLNTATILDVQTGASDSTITSIAGGSDGRVLILFYRDSKTVTIDCNASTGTAANRIICPGFDGDDIVMTPSSAFAGTQGSSVTLVYSGSLSRWIVTSIASAYIPTLRVSGAATIGTTLVIGASAHNFDATGYTTTGNIGAGDADADRLDIYAHPYTHGTAPTLSSCGTSPTISGNDKAGVVTMGSGSPSACTLTFNQAWTTNAPICTLAMNTNTRGLFVYVNAVSTSALTVEWANSAGTVSACNGGCIFYYQCVGRL